MRFGPGPRGYLGTIGQYALGSGASFGFFMMIGSCIRTDDDRMLTADDHFARLHSSMADGSQRLRILHFNDVYHVSGSGTEPVGGAARFGTMLHALQSDPAAGPTLTLFSGDAYFPSLESSISHGRHMVPVLNRLSIDASTFGNHEFDQGIDRLEGLIKDNNFPWVITNLTDKTT
ncbi:hypothetical protein LPJ61_005010, partial [Coemansia biformis]